MARINLIAGAALVALLGCGAAPQEAASTGEALGAAPAYPPNYVCRYYYSDASHTVQVGEKCIGCGWDYFWGTTSAYYVITGEACYASGAVGINTTCTTNADCTGTGRKCYDPDGWYFAGMYCSAGTCVSYPCGN